MKVRDGFNMGCLGGNSLESKGGREECFGEVMRRYLVGKVVGFVFGRRERRVRGMKGCFLGWGDWDSINLGDAG